MKRFIALMVVMILIVSMFGVMTAFAGGGSVSISKNTNIEVGRSYTYTITVKLNDVMDFMGTIKFSGVFSHEPIYLDFHPSSASDKTITEKVTFKPSSSQLGNTGKISVSGSGTSVDSSYNVTEFSVSGSRTATVVAAAASTPKPSTNSTKSTPKATKAPTEWDIAEQKVALLQSEEALSVDITKDPEVPGIVLTTLKEKQGRLTLNFGTYSCTIEGKSLAALPKDLKSIDLSMKMEKDDAFSAAVGGNDAYQLHFSHKGQLPGRFTYSFKAQDSAPGDTLYLYYYYDSSGIVEGMQSAVVDDNGYVTFDIYHCSSYFMSKSVIAGAAGTDFTAESKHAQELKDAQTAQAELETQLDEAESALAEAEAELESAGQQEPNPQTNDPGILRADAVGSIEKLFGVPYGALIAAMLGVAMLSVLLTMIFCRAGIFKKRERRRDDII